jgi:hypothetical protein
MGVALSSFNIATLKLVSPSEAWTLPRGKTIPGTQRFVSNSILGMFMASYILCICLSLSRECKFMKYNLWLSGIQNGVQLSV